MGLQEKVVNDKRHKANAAFKELGVHTEYLRNWRTNLLSSAASVANQKNRKLPGSTQPSGSDGEKIAHIYTSRSPYRHRVPSELIQLSINDTELLALLDTDCKVF